MKKTSLTLLLFFLTSFIYAQEPFVTVWLPINNWSITIPAVYDANNNYTVDFGDGTILTNQTGPCTHTYEESEVLNSYTVTISGTLGRLDFSTLSVDEAEKLIEIQQWGDIPWTSMENTFNGCVGFDLSATDAPNLSQVTSTEGMFYGVNISFGILDLDNWDVSNITNMKNMFREASFSSILFDTWDVSNVTNMEGMFSGVIYFNSPLNNWDVSGVTTMKEMFNGCITFNQPLDTWDVSNVTDMSDMFWSCIMFDQPLNSWDVSGVTDMSFMFAACPFNQSLNNWDVSSVTDMSNMFWNGSFNQPLNNWDVSNVTDMSNMFQSNTAFNQPLDNWDVSNVTDMSFMFRDTNFNQSIDNWDVSNVTNMSNMFWNCDMFNQPLNSWDVSSVTDMSFMFKTADLFNQPLENWDVSNVTTMEEMFYLATSFNQPLNNWDVSSVTNMAYMFHVSSSFDQPLNNWDVSNVVDFSGMFTQAFSFNQDLSDWDFTSVAFNFYGLVSSTAMSTENYDALLYKFAQLQIENQFLTSHDLYYCDTSVRDYLINDLGWMIFEDALGEECQGNTINGTVLFDEDNNGCDSNDTAMMNFLVKANNDVFSYATTVEVDGSYELKTYAETTYEVEVLGVPDYYTIVPETSVVSFTGFGNTEEIGFCVSSNEIVEDLSVLILPINEARPGFEAEYQLVIENLGIQSIPAVTVSFTYDDAMQSFVSAVPAVSSNSDNELTFNLSNFQPFESRVIDITMETFTPPTVNGDDILNFTATVTPNENDYTPQDNTFEFAQTVVNSFDPNDKRVVQGGEIYIEQATEYLDYIIRFQNTGTASAINIRVEDILSDDVDWSTFRPVSSSHNYRVEITDDNHVEFIFENINLPFEGEDEAGSKGFIAYKIKPVAGLEVGDIIHSNEVNIYFDYNLPIVTNSVTTQIIELLGVSDNILNKSLVLYPNPANDILYIKAENNVLPEEVVIYNLQGRELMSFNQNPESMDISDLSSGIYLVTVQTNSGKADYRLVKK